MSQAVADSIFAFCRAPQDFLLQAALADGPFASLRINDETFLVLSDPEAVHPVLNGSTDDFEKGALYEIPRTIGGNGTPGGTRVIRSPYVMHRHPAFWSEPETFRPTRFLDDGTALRR